MFSNNDIVCFFGDSITANGIWIRRIFNYYLNILHIPLEVYNCGIPGGTSFDAINHIDELVFKKKPTHVVVMFGMNDIGRDLYGIENPNESILEKRQDLILKSRSAVEIICDKIKNRNMRLTLCSPTPYDEVQNSQSENHFGCAEALKIVSENIEEIARNHRADYIDFNGSIMQINRNINANSHHIIDDDRVHPNAYGQMLMSQIFLSSQNLLDKVMTDFSELKESFDKIEYSDKENRRFDAEQRLSRRLFVELTLVPKSISQAERIPFIKRVVDSPKYSSWIRESARLYLENVNESNKLISEIEKLTHELKQEA